MPSHNLKMSRAKNWCFTINNPSDEEIASIRLAAASAEYLVFGRETAETGTPHLQGYVIFPAHVRLVTAKNRLGTPGGHFEVTRGTAKQASDYCKKDGDFEEFGECPAATQGRRSDLDSFYSWADEFALENGRAPTTPEVAQSEHVAVLTRYPGITRIARLRLFQPLQIDGAVLRDWQSRLVDRLTLDTDDRKLIFVIDEIGNTGKSWFVNFYLSHHPYSAQFLSVGKRDDIAHAIRTHVRVFLVDIPRTCMQYLQLPVLEQIKNGLVMSPKYHSMEKRMASKVHIVIFANEMPDPNALSQDRYEYFDIN